MTTATGGGRVFRLRTLPIGVFGVASATLIWLSLLGPGALPGPVRAEPTQLRGHMFISVMKDNTLSGETGEGVAYNLYFLSGGRVTYETAKGEKDNGRWHVDGQERLCMSFLKRDGGEERCVVVKLDGRTLWWEGENGSESATLRGGIVEGFLEN